MNVIQNECGEMPLHGLKLIENTLKHGIEVVTTKQHPAEMAIGRSLDNALRDSRQAPTHI